MYKRKSNCPYCNLNILGLAGFEAAQHIRWCELNPSRTRAKIKVCPTCNKEHTNTRSNYCDKNCSKEKSKDPAVRKKISEGRIAYLVANPELHPWKRKDKHKSKPCGKVKEYLDSKNIKYVEEWQPLSDRFFSIDIAFPDIKLGIEINGNQHYNADGTLSQYYQERHDLIVESGWTLIEVHYSSCFNFENLERIFNIGEQPDYSEYFKIKLERDSKNKIDSLPRGVKAKQKNDIKWEPFKELVLNSGIDFSKFGWVGKVSKILNTPSQKVNGWMKRYLPEFYENNCFKRK